ncbi:MAG: hypothetical protein ABIE68_04285 [bacterium]
MDIIVYVEGGFCILSVLDGKEIGRMISTCEEGHYEISTIIDIDHDGTDEFVVNHWLNDVLTGTTIESFGQIIPEEEQKKEEKKNESSQ